MTDTLQQQRIVNVLHQRAHDLLLGHSFANQQIGFIHTLDLNDGKPVKKRTLLEVEVAAQQKRQQKVLHIKSYRQKPVKNYIRLLKP